MNTKVIIILIILVSLGIGVFFAWKNISAPEAEKIPVTKEVVEEEAEEEVSKVEPNYKEEDVEKIPEAVLEKLCEKESWPPDCSFISDMTGRKLCEKCQALNEEKKEEEVLHQRLDISFLKGVWTVTGGAERALEQDIQRMKTDGVNIFPISPLFNVYPDGSIELVSSRKWEGREEQGYIDQIRKAHQAGLAVALELDPIYIDPSQQEQDSLQWLPMPEPTKQIFMENFVDVVLHWAEITEREKVELFSPINEPNSEILLGDKYAIEFLEKVLPQLKNKFSGKVVAKLADMGPKNISQYGTLEGYDYIAVDIYAIGVSEATFMEHFHSVVNQSLANVEKFNLEGFIFGELGAEPADEDFQSRLFQRIFEESWYKTKGYFICGWGPNIDPADPLNVEFTNKPAEDIIRQWYTKK